LAIRQGTLTVLAPISREPGKLEELQAHLETVRKLIEEDRVAGRNARFRRMRTLHYARWVIVEAQRAPDGRDFPASLLFSTQYDKPRCGHLKELVREGDDGLLPNLLEIYRCCEGFDAEAGPDAVRVRRYLLRHRKRASAFYVGAFRRSLPRIEAEERLTAQIRKAASAPALQGQAPHRVWRAIRTQLDRSPRDGDAGTRLYLAWDRRKAQAIWWGIRLALAAGLLAALWFAPVAVALAGVVVLAGVHWLRSLEERDADELARLEAAESDADKSARESLHEARLREVEDVWPQNQMTVVSIVKPSRLRRVLQRAVMLLIWARARWKFRRGLLDGVPTIHFAHWNVIDGGHRLVFVSNYDGSWSAYLDDFIAHGAPAVTAIWTHSYDFPKTRYLIYDGVTDACRFKRANRRYQLPPQVWYCAYPHLSVEEINRNSELVEGLYDRRLGRPGHRERTLAWLAKL
jgi:hypothetical protein